MSEDEGGDEDEEYDCLERYVGATAMCDWEGKMLLVDVTDVDHEEKALIIQWRLDRTISTVPLSELKDIRLKREESSDEGSVEEEELETENGDSETEGESTVSENEEEEVIEEAKSTQRRKLLSDRSSKYRGVTWCNRW